MATNAVTNATTNNKGTTNEVTTTTPTTTTVTNLDLLNLSVKQASVACELWQRTTILLHKAKQLWEQQASQQTKPTTSTPKPTQKCRNSKWAKGDRAFILLYAINQVRKKFRSVQSVSTETGIDVRTLRRYIHISQDPTTTKFPFYTKLGPNERVVSKASKAKLKRTTISKTAPLPPTTTASSTSAPLRVHPPTTPRLLRRTPASTTNTSLCTTLGAANRSPSGAPIVVPVITLLDGVFTHPLLQPDVTLRTVPSIPLCPITSLQVATDPRILATSRMCTNKVQSTPGAHQPKGVKPDTWEPRRKRRVTKWSSPLQKPMLCEAIRQVRQGGRSQQKVAEEYGKYPNGQWILPEQTLRRYVDISKDQDCQQSGFYYPLQTYEHGLSKTRLRHKERMLINQTQKQIASTKTQPDTPIVRRQFRIAPRPV